jgi:hypothetical protein
MNTSKFSRWLRFGANIGVVTGLFLLLVEMDQNNDLARAQIHQIRADSWGDFKLELADSEYLLPAMSRFQEAGGLGNLEALDTLSNIDRARVVQFLMHRYNDYDNLFYQYQQGFLDEEYYEYRIAPSIRVLAATWKNIGVYDVARPSFVDEVDRITSETQ